MKNREQGFWMTNTFAVLLVMLCTLANGDSANLPTNHKLAVSTVEESFKPSVNNTLLKMEARINVDDGLDLMQYENKENLSKPVTVSLTKSAEIPSEKGVSYVTAISEPRISPSISIPVSSRRKGEVFPEKKNAEPILPDAEDRVLRKTKASAKDSYLDALEHSHFSKDEKEGIVHTDVRPKVAKIFRRDYHEGPVYRPDSDRYGVPSKNPALIYGTPDYEGPSGPAATQSPFFPTPSTSYSLPEHSFDSFGPSESYGGPQSSNGGPHPSYGSPQPSYGAPSASYGSPQPSYGAPQVPQANYGPPPSGYGSPVPQSVYGPPSGSYLPSQGPQQGEARGT